jgi:hypothetical protein
MHKLFGASANPHVFSYINLEGGEKASIQSFPQPAEGDIVHLGLRIGVVGNYELKFSGMSTFAADQNFLVLDNKTDEVYEIRIDSIIPFSYKNGDSENRFDLVFDMTTGIDGLEESFDDIYVYINHDKLYIGNIENIDKNAIIEIYDVLGQKLYEEKAKNATNGLKVHLPSAYYIIRLNSAQINISKKIFIP